MDGFGPIHRESDEPVFHEAWEGRVFGMSMLGAGLPPIPLDARRHQLERLDPVQYLSSSYYERWLARINAALIEAGILTREEIQGRMQKFAANPDTPLPRRENPVRADAVAKTLRAGRPVTRKIRHRAGFAIGDKIVTRNLNPLGHTRLARYARCKHGVIVAHHGAHVFPDTNAHGLGENPQHLYTVRIAMRELWGDNGEPNESLLIDLWESYLEKDKAAAKLATRKNPHAAKKVMARTSPRAAKVLARAASPKRSLAIPLSSPRGTGKNKQTRATASTERAREITQKPLRRSR
jgi:nitrile hydratase